MQLEDKVETLKQQGRKPYLIIRMAFYERILFFVAAFLTIFPGLKTDLIGIICVAVAGSIHVMRARVKK